MTTVTQDDTDARTRKVIAHHVGKDVSDVTDAASIIDDLGADSLDAISVVMGLEEEFGIEISDDEGDAALTVADVIKLVRGKVPS